MKDKFINRLLIIVAAFLIVTTFVLDYTIDIKIFQTAAGISLLSNFIANKKIKYFLVSICLLVTLYVAFKWYLN